MDRREAIRRLLVWRELWVENEGWISLSRGVWVDFETARCRYDRSDVSDKPLQQLETCAYGAVEQDVMSARLTPSTTWAEAGAASASAAAVTARGIRPY